MRALSSRASCGLISNRLSSKVYARAASCGRHLYRFMRILHTFESYNDQSGARALKRLSEELVNRGHSVAVATGGPTGRVEDINGVRVHRFPIEGNSARGIRERHKAVESYVAFIASYK